ncbi:hypothetical protein VIGAN_03279400, partial [Vigna angularis var. angularis]
ISLSPNLSLHFMLFAHCPLIFLRRREAFGQLQQYMAAESSSKVLHSLGLCKLSLRKEQIVIPFLYKQTAMKHMEEGATTLKAYVQMKELQHSMLLIFN